MSLERIGRLEQRADHCDERTDRHEKRLNSHGNDIKQLRTDHASLKAWLLGAVGAVSFAANMIANYLSKIAQ